MAKDTKDVDKFYCAVYQFSSGTVIQNLKCVSVMGHHQVSSTHVERLKMCTKN